MHAPIRVVLILIFLWGALFIPQAGAVGFISSTGSVKPILISPVGEIVTVTPKLQWKMEWVKESNPQPSPSPQRLDFQVIIFHNDKPVWESRIVPGVSGQPLNELQVQSGVLAPGETFAWQVVAQFYSGSLAGRKALSDMRLFDVRGGCSVRIESIVIPKMNNTNVLPGVQVNAYSNQTPNLLLGQVVTNAAGEGRMSFAICPVKTTEKSFLSAARWSATKKGYRFDVVNGVKTTSDEWVRIAMRPAN